MEPQGYLLNKINSVNSAAACGGPSPAPPQRRNPQGRDNRNPPAEAATAEGGGAQQPPPIDARTPPGKRCLQRAQGLLAAPENLNKGGAPAARVAADMPVISRLLFRPAAAGRTQAGITEGGYLIMGGLKSVAALDRTSNPYI